MDRDNLIQENMNLVYHILHKNFPTFSQDEDIIQEGFIGLIKAADSYDSSKGKFSTYAYKVIYNMMLAYIRKLKNNVNTISLDYVVKGKDGSISEIHELIEDASSLDEFENVEYDTFTDMLSPKQQVVYDRVRLGKTRQEIADELGVTNQAVSCVVATIRRKLRSFCYENQD